MLEPWREKLLASNKFKKRMIILVLDAVALGIAAVIAYTFRFRSSLFEPSLQPSLVAIDYQIILVFVTLGWLFTFAVSGIYRLEHANYLTLNLQDLLKRSFTYFFALGFLSFLARASFSRTVFITLIIVGILNLIVTRSFVFFTFLRPMIKKKKISTKLMIIGRSMHESQQYSDWIIKNRLLGYAVVSRMECATISSTWLDEFEITQNHFCKQWLIMVLAHEMAHQYQWDVLGVKRMKKGLEPIMSHGPTFYIHRKKFLKHNIPLKRVIHSRIWFNKQNLLKC